MIKLTTILMVFMCLTSFSQDTLERKATFYHDKFQNRRTASGEIFSQNKLTAASNFYRLGTKVLVINESTGCYVIVTINDRMAEKHTNRRIDLSKKAFKKIASINKGIINVKITEL